MPHCESAVQKVVPSCRTSTSKGAYLHLRSVCSNTEAELVVFTRSGDALAHGGVRVQFA